MVKLLSTLLRPSAIGPPAGDDYWYSPLSQFAGAGIRVTPENAMNFSAYFAGVRVLSETVAQLPLKMYRARSDGGRDEARSMPIFDLLHDSPNQWQTSFEWREMGQGHLINRGNFYNQIVPGPRGPVDQLIPLNPDKMKPKMENGALIYEYHEKPGVVRRYLDDEIFHVRGMSNDGIVGMSLLSYMRESVGLGIAAEQYVAKQYSQGPTISGLLYTDKVLDKTAAKRIAKSWQDMTSGVGNAGKTGVLEDGLKWQKMGMTLEDAQMLESRKFQVTDIARMFRIPPHMLGDMERATFSNIEQQSLEFVIYCLMPWLVRWEQRFSIDLILAPQVFSAEFSVDGLLRGDAASRYAVYQIGVMNGLLSPNEARAYENRNPIAGGDQYFRPANLMPLDAPAQIVTGTSARARVLALSAGLRIVRKETSALAKFSERVEAGTDQWRATVTRFYGEHADYVSAVMCIPGEMAKAYTSKQASDVIEGSLEGEAERVAALAEMALQEAE